jgi:hypothetical protein
MTEKRERGTIKDATAIGPDTPLRLKKAAEIAFPDGGMTVSGLRREIRRGRLAVETIAGKQFTTLRNIEEMREKCRSEPKARDCGSSPPERTRTDASSSERCGSSATAPPSAALDAARAKLSKLRKGSKNISTPNPQNESATVTRLPSPSPTS